MNRHVFERTLLEKFTDSMSSSSSAKESLYADEENIIRYMSGYIAFKLLRKYQKVDSGKAAQYVECLLKMAVEGPESNFYDYTKEWMKLVDRGGLFHISDNAYLFFRALELQTRCILPLHLKNPSHSKDSLMQELLGDEDAQFFWSMLSVDISDCEESSNLLKEVAELWITIRGFSTTGAWMEQYKKEKKESLKGKKALRKELKAKESEESESE